MSTPLLITPLLGLAISVIVHAVALQYFPRMGLVDFPNRYGLSRRPIPYPTGILAVILFVLLLGVSSEFSTETVTLISGILILAAASFIDDRAPLSPVLRLSIQTFVAILLVSGGIRIDAVTNPLPGMLSDASSLTLNEGWALWVSGIFTVLWLLFTINALNWFDGIPGQVSMLSVIAFLTIGCLSVSDRVDQPELALLAFVLAGIGLGALLFDFPPPKLLMGDTGAMFFGLMIGVLTISSGGKVATAFLVLGVPLIDVLFVIVRRLRLGQAPWKGNATDQHLHHRLLAKGFSPRQVILLTAAIGAAFGITALFLSTGGKVIAGFLLFVVMLGLSWYSGRR